MGGLKLIFLLLLVLAVLVVFTEWCYPNEKRNSTGVAGAIEAAVRAAKDGLTVLIVCPTGAPAPG